ncbi:MAG: DUF1704 domain-containing protein [Candidatus Omnitrophota bacterium]|nr:DUF1704 domain-containing protein [Candidatus Omnitrophota bacterium]
MNSLEKIDATITALASKIDFYSLLTPVNREQERKRFFAETREGRPYDPVFSYKSGKHEDIMKPLENARLVLDEDDDLQMLLAKKLDFIKVQIELLEASDENFGDVAARLYGVPDLECLQEAERILRESKDQGYVFPEETVTSDRMVSILREELERKGIEWRVVFSGKIVPKITVSGKDRVIYVNSNIDYTAEEVERLKVHEINVHVYRGANGDFQPFRIFAEGLTGYDETEEGLAIVAEDASGCLEKDTRQMKLYAGRAVCAGYCMVGTFFEAFTKLNEFFPDYLAYRLVERGKRGLRDTSKRGGINKGFHYISGWRKVRKYVEENGDLGILYVGKIGIDDIGPVRRLIDNGTLTAPKYLPEFIDKLKRR